MAERATQATRPPAGAAVIDSDIVVIGGGMVGSTLASALGGAGFEVCVIDREDPAAVLEAGFDGRVSAIAWGSQRVLAALDLWPGMAADAEPILDIRVSDGDSLMFLHFDHADIGDRPFAYIVENRVTRRALNRRLTASASVRLIAPMTVVSLEREGGGVEAMLADGTKVRAALAIAADGRHSRVRRDAGIATTEWSYPQTGIVCTVAHERPHHGVAQERFLAAGPFAILPMTRDAAVGHRSSIVWTERAGLVPALFALDDGEFTAQLAVRFGDHLGAVEVVGPRFSYPLALMHAERYIGHRLALIGDAAHAIHPIAGQGLNLGLRDVAALAEVLVDARRLGLDIGHGSVLERYQRWRRFDNVVLAAATDGLNRLFSNDVLPIRIARDLGLAAVNRIAPAKRFFMRHAMGVLGELPRLVRGEPL
ncbi:MAG: UbiH/UbiF/VisC/COQ6 family ubiquinone biosynthesis hydroxylase [Proteobacteria bacterium]|nr:UbiH/UbiF/VisC/COQ6 family ubiquinone biosynthesis hydroxylase [Pseudomonadota bacterium]